MRLFKISLYAAMTVPLALSFSAMGEEAAGEASVPGPEVILTTEVVPENTAPRLTTEADRQKGKENVRAVIEELRELFASNAMVPPPNVVKRAVAPAYSRVVDGPNGFATLVYRARFTTAKRLFKALDGIVTGLTSVEVIEERNTIVVNDKKDNIKYYEAVINAMDIPSSQILVEAKVVEVLFSDGMQRNLSINYNNNDTVNAGATTRVPGQTGTINGGLGGDFKPVGDLDISFRWLLTAQDAKVLSSPNILISRNEVARIVTAEEIPIQEANTVNNSISFTTKFKRVGVTLEVEPQMINSDNVTIRLFPQVSNVLRYEMFPTGGSNGEMYPVPVVSVRSLESHLRMQDQQVVMMGGLYSARDTLQQERVPILSDIPFIGELFTGKNKAHEIVQLVFFIKIHIIQPDDTVNSFLYNPVILARDSEEIGELINSKQVFPTHEKGIVGLVDEMKESTKNSWKANELAPLAPEEVPVAPQTEVAPVVEVQETLTVKE